MGKGDTVRVIDTEGDHPYTGRVGVIERPGGPILTGAFWVRFSPYETGAFYPDELEVLDE